ncbi:tachylectin-related carbohydrate-binding protein [Amycolatopsis sp. WGS_07]|uniref:tachylectin-related carbohydrate-binding protein n=1 Tax=Amycolatopsis sp. WGS_07 TaxID=3076764 RepID=UPI0038732774
MRYQLPALGAAAGMVLCGIPGLAAAAAAGQSPAIEDYAYPGADKILAEQGIRLKAGDGNIRLAVCGDRTDVIRIVSNRNNTRETFCFESTGPKGYLSLEVPATFLAKGDGNAVEMTLTHKGTTQTVPVGKDTWTKLGESADPDNGPATLVEIKTSGPAPAPGPVDAAPYAAKITVGQPGVDGRGCSGVLVAPQWVATAARCFADDPSQGFAIPAGAPKQKTTAVVGRPDLGQTDRGAVVDVVYLVPRPDRDLVLAKLSAPVNGVTPVALSTTAPVAGETLKVTGYGRTADTWVPTKAHTASFTAGTTTDTTAEITGTVGPCKGDAGGPVVRERDGRTELVGLTSTSAQNGCLTEAPTTPGATQARTDNIAAWIKGQIPALSIACTGSVSIFAVKDDLVLYNHPDPVAGGAMSPNQSVIGNGGWSGFARVLAGPNGVIYGIRPNGDVYRYQWTGTGWSDNSREVIATGWWGWNDPATRPKLTVDARGDFYSTGSDGILWRMTYTESTKTWNTVKVDTGWDSYDLITAAGDGVLYARTRDGQLYRYAYDHAAGRWAQHKKLVGNGGWGIYQTLSSPGGDVLYGVTAGGDLRWYRYSSYTDTWAEGPTTIGHGGWQQFTDVAVQSNTCVLPK